MELFLIDAIGPIFRGYDRKRVNWSKIPFMHLANATEDDWAAINAELRTFTRGVTAQGYNAVTLDDLAHHPLHEPDVTARISILREKFTGFFNLLRDEFCLKVHLTTDVLPMTPAVAAGIDDNPLAINQYYRDLVCQVLDDFPLLSGLILRIGESDGNDVNDPIRTRLTCAMPRKPTACCTTFFPNSKNAAAISSFAPGPWVPPHRRSHLAPRYPPGNARRLGFAATHRFDETRRERFFSATCHSTARSSA